MATEVVMPKLGLTMETGTLGAWLVEEGQPVGKGQPLLEVITDKVTMEVESQAAGVLRRILVPAGEEVAVATPIGIIAEADEEIDDLVPAPATPVSAAPPDRREPDGAEPEPTPDQGGERPRHRASPKARKMIAAQQLDQAEIDGSGPGGRIVSADVEAYLVRRPAPARAAGPAAVTVPAAAGVGSLVELTRAQQVGAERLTASFRDIPHIQLTTNVSAVWLQQFREGYKIEGKKVSFNDLIVRATARALVEFPRLNSVLEDKTVRQFADVNIGVATDTAQGLLVPVLRQAPQKSIEEIAAETARLVERARAGALGPDDLSDGTFTISNLGMFGITQFSAIINPPQVAILAVGAIEQRVVALDNGALVAQPQLTLTLGADHRVVDGALAARFLQRLREILESPGMLA